MNLQSGLTLAISIVGAGLLTAYIFGLIRVMIYERKINIIYDNIEEKNRAIRSQPISMPVIDRRILAAREKVQPELDKLERKRKFLLDKLPLMRK